MNPVLLSMARGSRAIADGNKKAAKLYLSRARAARLSGDPQYAALCLDIACEYQQLAHMDIKFAEDLLK